MRIIKKQTAGGQEAMELLMTSQKIELQVIG
jgi:hypothetical protein